MEIGDIVYHKYYGIGQIEDIDESFFESCQYYLVYFYKEDDRLHNGGGRGPDYHYWLCHKRTLTLVRSVPLCELIERRRNENR